MNQDKILEKLKNIPLGSKITLVAKDITGQIYEEKLIYIREPVHNGYVTKDNTGGWALYGGDDDKRGFTVKCYEIHAKKPKWRKNYYIIKLTDIKDIKAGWN